MTPTSTLEKVKANLTIVLGIRESSFPFSYYDSSQRAIGYSQEIALKIVNAIKRELKLPDLSPKFYLVTSETRLPLILNGTVDLECGSTTNTAERQRQVGFSNSIFVVGTRLLTKTDSGVTEFSDLAGKNVVITAGTTSQRLLRKLNEDQKMNMAIITTKNHDESFRMLETGRAAAFMMDDALLYGAIARAKRPADWVVVGTPQSIEAYGCMLRKDDPAFKTLVDATIAGLMTSGEARRIYTKWFETPIPPRGLNLNLPLSAEMIELYSKPNDGAYQ